VTVRTLRIVHRSTLTLLVLFPAVLAAQRGGGMGRGGGGGGRGGGRGGGGGGNTYDELSSKDIGKFDPVKLLLDKHQDLKLDDQQTRTLTQLDSSVKLDNKLLADRIDSAQKALADNANARSTRGSGRRGGGGSAGGGGSTGSGSSDSTSVRSRGRAIPERQVIADALTILRREKDSVGLQALTILTEAQRPKANQLLKKRDDELTKILKGAGYVWPTAAPAATPAPAIPPPKDTVAKRSE
jgi:hypothetical protein